MQLKEIIENPGITYPDSPMVIFCKPLVQFDSQDSNIDTVNLQNMFIIEWSPYTTPPPLLTTTPTFFSSLTLLNPGNQQLVLNLYIFVILHLILAKGQEEIYFCHFMCYINRVTLM